MSDKSPTTALPANVVVVPDKAYAYAGNDSLHLDIYAPARKLGEPPWHRFDGPLKPTLLYFHGGGWLGGNKITSQLHLLPYLAQGWCVVTANYRPLSGNTNLYDCIDDCAMALDWVRKHAAIYRFDTAAIVLSGEAAGSHLALVTGMQAGSRKVRGIVNWYGVTDVGKAVAHWGSDRYANLVVGTDDPSGVYRDTSPVRIASRISPPVITIHGDSDDTVPYAQAEELHDALAKQDVKNRLVRIAGKKHGNFTPEEMQAAYHAIWRFFE